MGLKSAPHHIEMKFRDGTIKGIPKTNLNLHLVRSLTDVQTAELYYRKYNKLPAANIDLQNYELRKKLIDNPIAIKYATKSIIKNCANENVIYAEMRVTPLGNEKMSRMRYLRTVLDTIEACCCQYYVMINVIISIDDTVSHEENIGMLLEFIDDIPNNTDFVVGVDLGVKPKNYENSIYFPIYLRLQDKCICVCFNCDHHDGEGGDHKSFYQMQRNNGVDFDFMKTNWEEIIASNREDMDISICLSERFQRTEGLAYINNEYFKRFLEHPQKNKFRFFYCSGQRYFAPILGTLAMMYSHVPNLSAGLLEDSYLNKIRYLLDVNNSFADELVKTVLIRHLNIYIGLTTANQLSAGR